MEKIVVEVGQYGRLVFGSVKEMPEAMRVGGGKNAVWHELADGFALSTERVPGLTPHTLLLWGWDRTDDGLPFHCPFATPELAAQCVERIRAIVEFANKKLREKEDAKVQKVVPPTVVLQVVS